MTQSIPLRPPDYGGAQPSFALRATEGQAGLFEPSNNEKAPAFLQNTSAFSLAGTTGLKP